MTKSESKYFNTALRFHAALLSLLERKPFEYITVSEVCKQAGVNRSTFYLHYENTRDLLEETTTHMLEQFVSYFPQDTRDIAHRFRDCDLQELNFISEAYLHPYLSYMKENRRVFAAVLSQTAAFDTNSIFQRLFDHILDPILDRFHYPENDRRYTILFYLNGLTAIIAEWLKDGCAKSPEELSAIIHSCIFGRDSSLLPTDREAQP